jgi:lincosamide nucleotidyltransferase A/C/D/E
MVALDETLRVVTDGMTEEQATTLYELFDGHGVRCWVMGGWGVDALLGRATRMHKDLDLLVERVTLPAYANLIRRHGFVRKLEWSESQGIDIGGVTFDSAFVDAHEDGREIDVHVIEVGEDGTIAQLHIDPWPLPAGALDGEGTIAGKRVRCVSRSAQLAMHSTYDLPEKHRQDVRLLHALR